MSVLIQLAALGTALLGAVYIVIPRKMHPYSLRYGRSNDPPISKTEVWLYRFLGIGLVAIGLPRLL